MIPHLVWLALWGIAAWLAAIVNWFAALITGRSPDSLHGFLASYLRYATHVGAYFNLLADPFPSFSGAPGYPVDVAIAAPEPQNRLDHVLPRRSSRSRRSSSRRARQRPRRDHLPRLVRVPLRSAGCREGMRNLGAHTACATRSQTYAYAFFILTDRYPSFS